MSAIVRSRPIQAAFIGALVSALGSVGAAVVGAAMQAGAPSATAADPPAIVRSVDASSSGSCVALEDAVLRFAARHPDVARRYARPGDAADMPALATREQVASCGNPERVIEALYR